LVELLDVEHLLFLTHRIPYPPQKGDKIRSWHILKHLVLYYRVHLGCFIDDPHDRSHVSTLSELCVSMHGEPLCPPLAKLKSLSAFISGEPLTTRYYGSRKLQAWVNDVVRRYHIRRAFVFCSAMAPYVLSTQNMTRVLDMVDVDSRKWTDYAAGARQPARFVYAREGVYLLRFERAMAGVFDTILFVSAAEADMFRQAAPECASRIRSVTNGVDIDFFSPQRQYSRPSFMSGSHAVVFSGAMDYWPNVQAVQWFANKVMPECERQGQQLELWIVGANPTPAVRHLAVKPNIRVTGRVEDVRPYLAYAVAAVAPMRIARGIQNKILEAMAMAKPVVATPEAKEGIDATAGKDIIIATDAKQFAYGLRLALSERGAEIGNRARQKVEACYPWSTTLCGIEELLETRADPEA
jgi:sugar transferase (PEP-CTERM/EpsH1 system associated)